MPSSFVQEPRSPSPSQHQHNIWLPPPAPVLSKQEAAAAVAAEGGDITPPYLQFRQYAPFVAEVGDFALTPKGFRQLAFECGFGSCGGIGLGDPHILFSSASTKGHLTYDGLKAVCRVIAGRLPAYAAGCAPAPDTKRPATASAAELPAVPAGVLSRDVSVMQERSLKSPTGFRPPSPLSRPASRPGTAPPGGREASSLSVSPSGIAGRSSAAAEEGGPRGLRGLGGLMMVHDPPVVLREVLPLPRCDHRLLAPTVSGIRKMFRAGEVRSALGALLQLERDWEQAAEEAALTPPKRKASAKPAFGKQVAPAPPRPPQVRQPALSDGAPAPYTPLEGAVWLLVMGGCCLMAEGKYEMVQQRLNKAAYLLGMELLGEDHPLVYGHDMVQGLLHYYRQNYEEGLACFEKAQDLADIIARSTHNMEARKNTAVCWNNRGVCCTLLGRHSEAVVAYRHALRMLQSKSGVDLPETNIALSNLNKALKCSFAVDTRLTSRPGSAPPTTGGVFRTAATRFAPQDSDEHLADVPLTGSSVRLIRFLRQNISTPTSKPLVALPKYATRSTGEGKATGKKKTPAASASSSRAQKDKKGQKKPSPFAARVALPYPSYGVANVKLPVQKKKKKPVVDEAAPPVLVAA